MEASFDPVFSTTIFTTICTKSDGTDWQCARAGCSILAEICRKHKPRVQGPLYFEALHKDVPLNIIYYILKSGADLSLKDERGRTAFMFALDRANGVLPVDIFQFMVKNGADITQRDSTGCDSRDIARFARRQDVVDLIDKYRDTWIYALGNKTDAAVKFVEDLPQFQYELHEAYYNQLQERLSGYGLSAAFYRKSVSPGNNKS